MSVQQKQHPITATVNGVELPVPIRGNSAVATRIRAGVTTEEWAMPSATSGTIYTVKRCLRTGRILHSTCHCWKFNPHRDTEDCHHTAAVAEAAKLGEIVAGYSGPAWTLGALQAEEARLRQLLTEEDSRLIRLQCTGIGEVIALCCMDAEDAA